MQRAKHLISILLAFSFNLTYAQNTGNFTQFFFNPYSLNPSFAGIDGHSVLSVAYRKQWSGIEGGPEIYNFSFHTPLKAGLNLGMNAANDKRGILSNTGMLVTLGYSVPLGEGKYLRFGLSGGGSWNTIDLTKVNPATIASDPALINLLNQNASIIGNAGASLHLKSFHAGFTIPNLFAPSYVSEDAFTITEVKPLQAFVVHASNRFYFADNKHVFEPYVVYRHNENLPDQLEAAAVVHLNHIIWVGGSWKQEFGISALGGIKLNNKFAIGGSYTLKNTGVNELSFPTYEIHLSLLGGPSKSNDKSNAKHTAPFYSFVHTELPKKTRAEVIHDNYAAAITKADKSFAGKNYEEARIEYFEAQKYKPTEHYPKTKIDEIGKIIAYETDIKKADKELASKTYEQALADYEAASNLNPNEKYPKEKIEEIKALRAKNSEASDLDRRYKEEIAKADKELASKTYEQALADYEAASNLNPNEKYPKEKIEEIKALRVKNNEASDLDRRYKEEIAKADAALKAKDYATAKKYYLNAEALKPKELYPFDEVKEIDRLMAMQVVTKPEVKPTQEPEKENLPVKEIVKEPVKEVVKEPLKELPVEAVDRHETFKRERHVQELESGNYVIVGVFGSGANAKNMAKKLVYTGFNANYGFGTEKSLWYVHIFNGDDINSARKERDKYRKHPLFKDAWLLTIQN